jgi:hypothetical protein
MTRCHRQGQGECSTGCRSRHGSLSWGQARGARGPWWRPGGLGSGGGRTLRGPPTRASGCRDGDGHRGRPPTAALNSAHTSAGVVAGSEVAEALAEPGQGACVQPMPGCTLRGLGPPGTGGPPVRIGFNNLAAPLAHSCSPRRTKICTTGTRRGGVSGRPSLQDAGAVAVTLRGTVAVAFAGTTVHAQRPTP